jgi:predicted nucleotidyltransferase
MSLLTPAQSDDLKSLRRLCRSQSTPVVVIGALAYQAFITGSDRHTVDVDVAVAIDLDRFEVFKEKLIGQGWERDRHQEQRWRGPNGSLIDILPAGANARAAGHLTWPESQMKMSLTGFNHVFVDAVDRNLAPGFRMKVVRPPVLFLLKVAAFLDDEQRRRKDLEDIHNLLRWYEWESKRLYSHEVFEAELSDIQFAPAFLLGLDVGKTCNRDECGLIRSFVARAAKKPLPLFHALLQYEREVEGPDRTLGQRLKSFQLGLEVAG